MGQFSMEKSVPPGSVLRGNQQHILNLLHRLLDGRPVTPPTIEAPQALTLTTEPRANVERYDALRRIGEARHAS